MSAVLGALRDHFLRPATASATRLDAPAIARARAAVDVAVLCGADAAPAVGTVVALTAARRTRSSCAVVALWNGRDAGGASSTGAATPAARRLAARLEERGVAARSCGRLLHVALPADPADARVIAERLAATVDVPLVTVVGGPRPPAFDAFLGGRTRVIVAPPADAADGLAELAIAEAARLARAIGRLDLPASAAVRLAVRSGSFVPPSARAAADLALDGRGA